MHKELECKVHCLATSKKYDFNEYKKPTIYVRIKNVYGREVIYPDCPLSVKFAEIAGTKTLGENTVRSILDMGYKIEVRQLNLSNTIVVGG